MRFCDLHAHLGASTPADVLWDLAVEQGIKVGTKSYEQFIENMLVPNHMVHAAYLSKFTLTQSIQSSLQGIERSMYHAIAHAYKKLGLDQIELRFDPALRNLDKRYDIDAVIAYATFGMKKAMLAFPIKAGIIIETDRTFTPEMSTMLARKAVQFRHDGVVGFDMAGHTTNGFDIKHHTNAFNVAKAGGLSTTVHAAELYGSKEVIDAINYLGVDRIGHGIQIVSDKEAMKLVADNHVHLEICPTSNVITKCVDSYDDIVTRIGLLTEWGISWNLNTDGSEFLDTSVEGEYEKLTQLGLPKELIIESQVMARRASFIK